MISCVDLSSGTILFFSSSYFRFIIFSYNAILAVIVGGIIGALPERDRGPVVPRLALNVRSVGEGPRFLVLAARGDCFGVLRAVNGRDPG